MSYRYFVSIVLLLAAASPGFTQSLGDLARAERARRGLLAQGAASPDRTATVVGREALIKEALHVSGAKRQLEQLLQTSMSSLSNRKLPEGFSAQEYQRIVSEVFNAQQLTRMLEKSIAVDVKDKTITDIVRWYRSPLGQKVMTAEMNAMDAQASTRFQQFVSTLEATPPSASRLELVEAIGGTALGISRPAAVQASVASNLPNTVWFLFAYNSLSEAELSGYLAFLKSPSTAAFHSAVWSGMDATFADAAQHFDRRLAEGSRPVVTRANNAAAAARIRH
jgi:hypothetical protein